jgi:inosose dehydratase
MRLTEIALCPDLAHLLAGGSDPVEVVRAYRDRIPYVHLKDYADGAWLPIGDGKVDFKGVLRLLSGDQEPVWATVEHDGKTDQPFEMAKLLRTRALELGWG